MSDHEHPEIGAADEGGRERAPLDRLRAADPAADAAPDMTRLRAAIDLRRPAAPDSLDAVRAGRHSRLGRSRWLQVAAVAAGAAVVAGSYGLGRANAPAPVTAAPAIDLAAGASGQAEFGGAAMDAAVAGDQRLSIWPGWGAAERTVFHGEGFSDAAGTATAWTYDAASSFTADRAAALAATLGLDGAPELRDGTWQVGPPDGTGPSLTLYPDSQTSFSFYDPGNDPYQCVAPATGGDAAAPDASGGAGEPAVDQPCETVDLGPAPGPDAMAARLREVIGAAGLDPDAYEYVADPVDGTGDAVGASLSAFEVKEERRTGSAWYLWMTGAGVQSISGTLAPLTSLGDYPVISAAAAVDRLTDPRFGTIGFAWPAAEGGPVDTFVPEPTPSGPPTTAVAGGAIPWPVADITLVSATLGLAQHHDLGSRSALLVPAYEFADADGRRWSVIAVAEESLDLTSR
ncbi:MAG: hypothetical protein ACYC1Z_08020 [Georgenia sp.]